MVKHWHKLNQLSSQYTLPEFQFANNFKQMQTICFNAPTKQWLQVEVDNEVVMHLLLSFISNLDFKPLFVSIEAKRGSVHFLLKHGFV